MGKEGERQGKKEKDIEEDRDERDSGTERDR